MGSLKIWNQIPVGSKLELWVEEDGDPFVSSARLVDEKSNELSWAHADLCPTPNPKKLNAGKSWTIRVRVGFTGAQASATINCRIVKPNGAVYGSAYAYTVTGKREDVVRAQIIAVVKKAAA